jgi:hypothetical protein
VVYHPANVVKVNTTANCLCYAARMKCNSGYHRKKDNIGCPKYDGYDNRA